MAILTSCRLSNRRKSSFLKSRTGSPLLRSWLNTSTSAREDCARIVVGCAVAIGGEAQTERKQIEATPRATIFVSQFKRGFSISSSRLRNKIRTVPNAGSLSKSGGRSLQAAEKGMPQLRFFLSFAIL